MKRPTSVTVFGVLNIVFGVWGLLGLAMAAIITLSGAFPAVDLGVPAGGFYEVWTKASFVVGALVSVVLIAAGFGLLRMRRWARIASIGYAVYCLLGTGVGLVVQWIFVYRPMLEQFQRDNQPALIVGLIGGLVGTVVALTYPLLLWYFMTRRHVVAAFAGTPEPTEAFSAVAAAAPLAADSENPYVSPQVDPARHVSAPGAAESIAEAFVPSKNGPALAAYYLGLLSLLPCLGFPIGVAAVYFGVKGLRRVRANPAVRGGIHAWVGLICGSLFGLFNFLLLGLAIAGGIAAAMGY